MPGKKSKKSLIEVKTHPKLGYVVPGYTIAQRGHSVWFSNRTKEHVYVQFSTRRLFGRGAIRLSPVGKKACQVSLKARLAAPIGLHPYAVFCYEAKRFAVGNSMPIIIIQPPPPVGK